LNIKIKIYVLYFKIIRFYLKNHNLPYWGEPTLINRQINNWKNTTKTLVITRQINNTNYIKWGVLHVILYYIYIINSFTQTLKIN